MSRSYPRPHFRREESWRYKRVKEAWRSPRGKTSRVRRSKKGWPPVVKIGYAKPKVVRYLHPSGRREVPVSRPKDLQKIDANTQVARIAHTVGENKRVQILEEAKKLNIHVLNPGVKRPSEPEVTAAEPTPEPAPIEEKEEKSVERAEEKPQTAAKKRKRPSRKLKE